MNTKSERLQSRVPWSTNTAIIGTVIAFVASQVIAGMIIGLYPAFRHWTSAEGKQWLSNSMFAQFLYVLMTEAITLEILWLFIKRTPEGARKALGLARDFRGKDIGNALAGLGIYYASYIVIVGIIAAHFVNITTNNQQDVGFQNAQTTGQLFLTFISLVILPPIAEEIMFRGFLFAGLRKKFKFVTATFLTSLLFGAPHLLTGTPGEGLLWIAGADTFILSLVLCYMREKTGALYSGMLIHAAKNGIAFAVLFLR